MTIACYILSAVLLAFFIYEVKAAWATTADYYSAYDMSFNMGDAVLYAIEQAMATLTFAFIAFISGWIISEDRIRPTSEQQKRSRPRRKLRKLQRKLKPPQRRQIQEPTNANP